MAQAAGYNPYLMNVKEPLFNHAMDERILPKATASWVECGVIAVIAKACSTIIPQRHQRKRQLHQILHRQGQNNRNQPPMGYRRSCFQRYGHQENPCRLGMRLYAKRRACCGPRKRACVWCGYQQLFGVQVDLSRADDKYI